ncbi:MAG: methyltransferase [Bacteroidota bacterium]|nr:methyltransferase [Bacteroidota bacterium]
MGNPFFQFKQFTVYHDRCAMKVTTDSCLFGAWIADVISNRQRAKGKTLQLLDIGTGTGLLSLMVAQNNAVIIDAVEIDLAASAQAGENIAASPWINSIQVVNYDVLQWKPEKPYDMIVSNPPFYENEIRSEKVEKNKAHHDAGLRLADLLSFIKRHLKEDGAFFLLLPAKRKTEVDALLKKAHLFAETIVLVQQTLKHQPFRLMIQGRHQPVEKCNESRLAIKDADDAYTPAFIDLLRPYYLYL